MVESRAMPCAGATAIALEGNIVQCNRKVKAYFAALQKISN
jgi:hypothetical protein